MNGAEQESSRAKMSFEMHSVKGRRNYSTMAERQYALNNILQQDFLKFCASTDQLRKTECLNFQMMVQECIITTY